MNSKLQLLFDSLQQDRNELISTIKSLSVEKFNYAPVGKWSINQILAHLITAERLSVMYIQKKILGIKEAKDTGLWEDIKFEILKVSQRLPLKFKAPKMVVERTPVYTNTNELLADWDKTGAELEALLEKFDDTQTKKRIYKHFLAGRLNIQHALMFLSEHIIHHQPQINRLLK
ncbi:MAG: DinB family protein [Bacteroidota bacterium]